MLYLSTIYKRHELQQRWVKEFDEEEYNNIPDAKSPADSEKRTGGVFEDLDLGLDPSEDVSTSVLDSLRALSNVRFIV